MRWLLGALAILSACAAPLAKAPPSEPPAPSPSAAKPSSKKATPEKRAIADEPAYGPSAPATIAVGARFVCAIRADHRVACWGDNDAGQLGQGDGERRDGPVLVKGLERAVEIAAGELHACARLADGSVWCWGRGDRFRLGKKLQEKVYPPLEVEGVAHAVALGAAREHSCAVLADGGVRCWGDPGEGKLGLDHLDHVTEPANVRLDVERATGVALTDASTCVRDGSGRVSCWGVGDRNNANQQKFIDGVDETTELFVAPYTTCARSKRGQLRCWNDKGEAHPRTDVPAGATVVAVTSGGDCGFIDGVLSCWGHRPPGVDEHYVPADSKPLAYPELAGAKEVRAGGDPDAVLCARDRDGGVHCWGSNEHGQLGRPRGGRYPRAVAVALPAPATELVAHGAETCALLDSGRLSCWGDTKEDIMKQLAALQRVSSVALNEHGCAVHRGGKVACWTSRGMGGYGELGKAVPKPKPPPKPAGGLEVPQLWGWGRGELFVEEVAGLERASEVAVSSTASCALTASGVSCWGDDGSTRAASELLSLPCQTVFGGNQARCDDAKKPRKIQASAGAKRILGTDRGFCMITRDDTVACWSSGSPQPVEGVRDAVSLHAGGPRQTCAIDRAGALWCWEEGRKARRYELFAEPLAAFASGSGRDGAPLMCAATRAGRLRCKGSVIDALFGYPVEPVTIAGAEHATQVVVGDTHGCALLTGGAVRCWGEGDAQMKRPHTTLTRSTKPLPVSLDAARD